MPDDENALTVEEAAADAATDPAVDLTVRGINHAIKRGDLRARKLRPEKRTSPYLIQRKDWLEFKRKRKEQKKRAQPSQG